MTQVKKFWLHQDKKQRPGHGFVVKNEKFFPYAKDTSKLVQYVWHGFEMVLLITDIVKI
jgi:hypothetical protein